MNIETKPGTYGAAWPNGVWITTADIDRDVLFLDVNDDGAVCGKSHSPGDAVLRRPDGSWISLGESAGNAPAAFGPNRTVYVSRVDGVHVFDYEGRELRVIKGAGYLGSDYIGSNGIRYVKADGTVVSGDNTYGDGKENEYTELPDGLRIGQGHDGGGIVAETSDGQVRHIATGFDVFCRVKAVGSAVAICWTDTKQNFRLLTTEDALRALPVDAPPLPTSQPPAPPAPPTPTPTPKPEPTPVPVTPTPFDPAAVKFVDSPGDVVSWPQTATITSVRFDGDRFQVDHTGRESWPDLPFGDGKGGTVQYTLGVCCFVEGQWVGAAVVQFWKGRELAAGGGVSTFSTDWFYDDRWGALKGHQPAPNELVAVYAISGNDRDNDNVPTGANRQRTDFALVRWGQDYTASTSQPVPTPQPTPTPVPSPTPTPIPAPFDPSPLEAAIADLLTRVQALEARPVPAPLDMTGLAHKGDRVTVIENAFGAKLVLHGTIDK